jgi:MSHA biogenesis protein MshP
MKLMQHKQQGFAAIAAIFLVVVLAALGGFMLTFSNTQQLTSAQDIQGSRAYWAARAGLEWGIGSVVDCANNAATCPRSTTTVPPFSCPAAPLATELAATFEVNLKVTVTLTCAGYIEAPPEPVATANRYIYQLTAVATSGTIGTVSYVERSVTAAMECMRIGPKDGLAYTGADPLTYSCG